eukprot:TRINITY_DN12769_c0_g6_i1.p1 TRINITY_DN12769_c0_g6~~TRINITY_DN12769_c0_g6_i1.p1  ORF type:complete len:538 (-),score=124.19 TRINITY_DN12769_c0_g6_i1:28-1641(-)
MEGLKQVVDVLKEKEEEAKASQERLAKIIKDINDLEAANKLVEEYKEKYTRLEETLREQRDKYEKQVSEAKKLLEKTNSKHNAQVKSLNKIIEELRNSLASTQSELKERDEVILKLNKNVEELVNNCEVKVSYSIVAGIPIEDLEEIHRVKEENKAIEKKFHESKELTKELESKVNELQNQLLEEQKEYTEDVETKEKAIVELQEEIKSANEEISQMQEKEKTLNRKLREIEDEMENRQKETENLERERKEMAEEIKILILHSKSLESDISQKELLLKQQQNDVEILQSELEERDTTIDKLSKQNNRLSAILNEKRVMLHNARTRIKDLSRNVIYTLQGNIKNKDKAITILKEMVRDHHEELKAKNKDIVRLRSDLARREDRMIKLRTVNDFRGDVELVCSGSPVARANKISVPLYKERYLERIEDYYKAINAGNCRNNSMNMRNALRFDRHSKNSRNRPKIEHVQSLIISNNSPDEKQSEFLTIANDSELNVGRVIRMSLAKKLSNKPKNRTPKLIKLFNSPITNKQKPNHRNLLT